MNILLVSESFIMREYMNDILKELVKDANVNIKEKITQTTREELLEADFAFIDIHQGILKDLKIIDYIKLKNRELKVVIVDSYKNKIVLKKALKYGIEGYITNLSDKDEFIYMIKKVLSGKKAYEVESIENVINSKAEHDIDRLTKREKEVLRELSRGLNNKDIASNLFITECTVKKHVSNIFEKLNFKNRHEAIIYINNLS